MADIFLSYRRTDSDYALLLFAWLTERFGASRVFWDREGIDAGKDFRRVLSRQLRTCRALVALIGPGWSASEWIEKEIAVALRRKIFVLPVLVGGAPHPAPQSLPRPIRRIAVLQNLETADLRFRAQFIEALERAVRIAGASKAVSSPRAGVSMLDDVRTHRLALLLRDQSDRIQDNALDLFMKGDVDAALAVLNEGFEVLMALLDLTPGDAELEVRLGYLYKNLAMASESASPEHARRYTEAGRHIFEGLAARKLRQADLRASVWNGLGNIHLLRGEYDSAIECCQRAVNIVPSYARAWADLFLAYEGAAKSGKPNIAALRHTLRRLKATVGDDHTLAAGIGEFETSLHSLEEQSRRVRGNGGGNRSARRPRTSRGSATNRPRGAIRRRPKTSS